MATVDSSLLVPGLDEDGSPLTDSILIFSETLGWNWVEVAFFVKSKLDPLMRKPAVILEIVKWLERKPLGSMLLAGAGSVVDAKLHKQFLDVERRKELPLSVNYDLSRRLARDWKEWLHDFRVRISHSLSFPGVKALVHVGISEVVLPDDLDILLQGGQFFLNLLDGFRLLLFQT